MAETAIFEPGGYRYVRGPFQYSAGVAAQPGFAIERVRFAHPKPMVEGFRAIEEYLTALGRPFTAFCACELRSPAPFTEQGFIDFHRVYVGTLERWGIFKDDENPGCAFQCLSGNWRTTGAQFRGIQLYRTGTGNGYTKFRYRRFRRSARRTRRL